MKAFKQHIEVLTVVEPALDDSFTPFYDVVSLEIWAHHEPYRAAKRKLDKAFRAGSGDYCRRRVVNVGRLGEFDHFIGKYVGQFIDEAFPCQSR